MKRYVTQKRLQVDVDNTREVLEAEISKHFATVVRCPNAWPPQAVFLTVAGISAENEMLLFGTTRCVLLCAPRQSVSCELFKSSFMRVPREWSALVCRRHRKNRRPYMNSFML